MKKTSICILLFLAFLEVHAQFSLGADLLGMGLPRAQQKEAGLMVDSTLSNSRLVFLVYSNLVGAYKVKNWEFSVGIGHEYMAWNQKFNTPTEEVKAFVGSNSQSDSSDLLKKVSYSSNLIPTPIGAKYLFEREPGSWANGFISLQLIPAFAFQRTASPIFNKQYALLFIPYYGRVSEDPELVEATQAYFQPKINSILLDAKAEAGFRLWGRKRKYAVDLSIGYLYGFIPLHEQMRSAKGPFGNLALRFFFKSKSSAEGLI